MKSLRAAFLTCVLLGLMLPACGSSTTNLTTKLTADTNQGPLIPGATGSFTATVTNQGPGVAQNVSVQVELPPGFEYQATTEITGDGSRTQPADPARNDRSPEWGLWVLGAPVGSGATAAYSSISVSFTVLAGGSPGQYDLTARSAADNANSDQSPPTVRVNVAAAADLSLQVSATPTSAHHNSKITYKLIITNTGSGNAQTAEALVTLPAGFVYSNTTNISGNSARANDVDPQPASQLPFWGDFTIPARSDAGPGTLSITFVAAVAQQTAVGSYPVTVQITDDAGDKVVANAVVPVQIS